MVFKEANNDKNRSVAPYQGNDNPVDPDRPWAWYPPEEYYNKSVEGDCLGDRTSQYAQ